MSADLGGAVFLICEGEMREIELRAWDKSSLSMIEDYAHIGSYGELCVSSFHSSAYSHKSCPDLIIMQYTNHRDIDNVKIFDQDIIEYTAIVNHKGRIFHNVIEYFESCNNCGFMIIGKDRRVRYNLCRDQIWNHKIKVVGNMCLTPKLMNE